MAECDTLCTRRERGFAQTLRLTVEFSAHAHKRVYAVTEIKPNDIGNRRAVSYFRPTYTAIRSGSNPHPQLFYRAMHFNAKRGIAITCRPSVCLSVCPSVCDVGGSGPNRLEILESLKLISRTISPTPSLFVAQTPSTNSQGNMGKFWGE